MEELLHLAVLLTFYEMALHGHEVWAAGVTRMSGQRRRSWSPWTSWGTCRKRLTERRRHVSTEGSLGHCFDLRQEERRTCESPSSSSVHLAKLTTPDESTTVQVFRCPPGFSDGFACGRPLTDTECVPSCYKLIGHSLQWKDARSNCFVQKSDLVTIETRLEDIHIGGIINNYGQGMARYWTSGSDEKKEGQWIWRATGAAFNYTNWVYGNPNNFGPLGQDYNSISRFYDLKWDDQHALNLMSYICEVNV